VKRLALFLLVIGMWSNYGWQLFGTDLELQGAVFNLGQQALLILCFVLVPVMSRSVPIMVVCGLLSLYSLTELFCTAWWLIAPWPIVPGQDQCSTRFHIPFGAIGMGAGATLVYQLAREHGKP
jgi:hypothetical protein